MFDPWFVMLPFAIFFAWLFGFGMRRSKQCPDCGEPLPILQSPFTKTKRQWWEGGYLCPKCGCETDTAGRRILAGTPPRPGSIASGIALLVVTGIPFTILLTMLLRR